MQLVIGGSLHRRAPRSQCRFRSRPSGCAPSVATAPASDPTRFGNGKSRVFDASEHHRTLCAAVPEPVHSQFAQALFDFPSVFRVVSLSVAFATPPRIHPPRTTACCHPQTSESSVSGAVLRYGLRDPLACARGSLRDGGARALLRRVRPPSLLRGGSRSDAVPIVPSSTPAQESPSATPLAEERLLATEGAHRLRRKVPPFRAALLGTVPVGDYAASLHDVPLTRFPLLD